MRVFHEDVSAPWATFIMQLEGWKFSWDPCLLDQSFCTLYVWELSNLSLRSPNKCFLYYSIIGDMIYLYCIDMCCSSFLFAFSLLLFDFFHHFFLTIYPFFCPILTLIHLLDSTPFFMIHWWLDCWLLLSSLAHVIFLCITLYVKVWIWSLGIWA